MITIEKAGRRHYIIGSAYAQRDAIRAAGAHWDGERRAWWIGKPDEAEALVARLNAEVPEAGERRERETGDGDDTVVAGRGKYQGKSCYLVGRRESGRSRWDHDRVTAVTTRDGVKALLASRDGTRTFWVPLAEVEVVKRYGRPQTIGGLKAFAAEAKTHGTSECQCSCHRDPQWHEPGHVGFDGCERCGCEAT